jgi:hypothetical protein
MLLARLPNYKGSQRRSFLADACEEYFEKFDTDDFGNDWTEDSKVNRSKVSLLSASCSIVLICLWTQQIENFYINALRNRKAGVGDNVYLDLFEKENRRTCHDYQAFWHTCTDEVVAEVHRRMEARRMKAKQDTEVDASGTEAENLDSDEANDSRDAAAAPVPSGETTNTAVGTDIAVVNPGAAVESVGAAVDTAVGAVASAEGAGAVIDATADADAFAESAGVFEGVGADSAGADATIATSGAAVNSGRSGRKSKKSKRRKRSRSGPPPTRANIAVYNQVAKELWTALQASTDPAHSALRQRVEFFWKNGRFPEDTKSALPSPGDYQAWVLRFCVARRTLICFKRSIDRVRPTITQFCAAFRRKTGFEITCIYGGPLPAQDGDIGSF